VALEGTACIASVPSALLLIGLAQFVSLQISKIEPICVGAWAAKNRPQAAAIQSMPVVMSGLVSAMGGGWLHLRLWHLLPRFLKPPLIAGRIHDACRAAARKDGRA
jgi:hypothetical protein